MGNSKAVGVAYADPDLDSGTVSGNWSVTGSLILGGNTLSGTELAYLDGITPGTATASKALVVNSSKGIATITSATITTLTSTTLISTNAQVTNYKALDGTAALAVADSTGVVTVAAGLTMGDGINVVLNATTGSKIGTATTQKLGFYNATPVIQQAATGTATGFTAGAGTPVTDISTFTGDSGSKAYTIGDIVLALKNLGLMAAS